MKKLFIILSFLTIHSYTMELIPSLPHEITTNIIHYSLPKLNLYYHNAHKRGQWYYAEKETFPDNSAQKDQKDTNNAVHNLQHIASVIKTVRLINKNWKSCITNNIATWLGINTDNANALLIRAAQANIPYFMQLAITHKANLNFVHKPSGHTPLSYATTHNAYNTCAFLLAKGASVHVRRENPYAAYADYDSGEWPIHRAIKNNNLELVQLFIKHHTRFDFQFFLTTPLLALAAKQNNPYILTALLEARPHTDSFNYWAVDEIEHALETAQRFDAKTDKEKLEKRTCINILETALENASQSFKETMKLLLSDFTTKL